MKKDTFFKHLSPHNYNSEPYKPIYQKKATESQIRNITFMLP